LAVSTCALLACAATGNVAILLALRAVAGVASAVNLVVGGALAAQAGAGQPARRVGLLLGVYFAGPAIGVVVSGLAVPALLAHTSSGAGWREGWVLLAALSGACLLACLPTARHAQEPPAAPAGAGGWPVRSLAALIAAYTLYGAGYISYMTFIVAFLTTAGAGPGTVTLFWVVLGATAVATGFTWAPLLARLRGGRAPALVIAVVTAGALVPLLADSPAAALASAVLFGASFLAVVGATTAVARQALPAHHWTAAIATLTGGFALGQCAGPVLAGVLSDGPSGIRAGLTVSVGILTAALLVALAQPDRRVVPTTSPASSRLPAVPVTPLSAPTGGPDDDRSAAAPLRTSGPRPPSRGPRPRP
jgi:MFS family permease